MCVRGLQIRRVPTLDCLFSPQVFLQLLANRKLFLLLVLVIQAIHTLSKLPGHDLIYHGSAKSPLAHKMHQGNLTLFFGSLGLRRLTIRSARQKCQKIKMIVLLSPEQLRSLFLLRRLSKSVTAHFNVPGLGSPQHAIKNRSCNALQSILHGLTHLPALSCLFVASDAP